MKDLPRFHFLLALALSASPLAAQTWRMQYFYDKADSSLSFNDIQFPSPARGVATGFIAKGGHSRPVALVTSDGGAHWQITELKESPVSLFFLNENFGWMVTTKGLWATREAGRSWHKLPKVPGEIFRVYFATQQHGWAAGARKKIFETRDGGQHWTAVAAAAGLPGEPQYSAYTWIAFVTPQTGIITGWNQPPEHHGINVPDWMDPKSSIERRETPHLSYQLTTYDGGKHWTPESASLFGSVTRVRFSKSGIGLGLIQFGSTFEYPSEVYRIEYRSDGNSVMAYRNKKIAITDLGFTPDGTAYLAGVEEPGQLRDVVPGKVKVLKSSDYQNWIEMPVDYRAEATGVVLAIADDHNLWLATDGGMILKLAP